MRVLGIDPGYAIVGYGVLDADGGRVLPVTFGAVTTQAHTRFEDRLAEVYDDVCLLFSSYAPDAMAIETLFFTTNQKTAVAVAEALRGKLASIDQHMKEVRARRREIVKLLAQMDD